MSVNRVNTAAPPSDCQPAPASYPLGSGPPRPPLHRCPRAWPVLSPQRRPTGACRALSPAGTRARPASSPTAFGSNPDRRVPALSRPGPLGEDEVAGAGPARVVRGGPLGRDPRQAGVVRPGSPCPWRSVRGGRGAAAQPAPPASPPGSEPGLGRCSLSALVGAPPAGREPGSEATRFQPSSPLGRRVSSPAVSPRPLSPRPAPSPRRAPPRGTSVQPPGPGSSGAVRELRVSAQSPACGGRTGGRGGGSLQNQPASPGRDPRAR